MIMSSKLGLDAVVKCLNFEATFWQLLKFGLGHQSRLNSGSIPNRRFHLPRGLTPAALEFDFISAWGMTPFPSVAPVASGFGSVCFGV